MLGIVAENVHMFEQQMLRYRLAMICGCYSKTLEVRFALFIWRMGRTYVEYVIMLNVWYFQDLIIRLWKCRVSFSP